MNSKKYSTSFSDCCIKRFDNYLFVQLFIVQLDTISSVNVIRFLDFFQMRNICDPIFFILYFKKIENIIFTRKYIWQEFKT